MDSTKLNDWMQVVGIFAVVASLIFLGLQMRQTQDIALTESGWNRMLAEIETRRNFKEFPDIWAKGNAGEELNPSEAAIYRALIRDLNALEFFKYYNATILDHPGAADAARWDMAGFLYENPGARREWELLRDEIRRYRGPHVTGQYRNFFEEAIRADLAVLEKTYGP